VTLPATIPFLGFGWDDALFMLLAAVLIGSALLVVGMRDIIRCGLAMIICFAALAGIYVIAGAPVVAAAQVLVYIGAISVLVLFAIMLTQTKAGPRELVFQTQAVPAAVLSLILALLFAVVVGSTDWPATVGRIWTITGQPTVDQLNADPHARGLAPVLFTDYTLPFEVVSVLLLAAVVGGVFLAKRERKDTD
jgi:NADH:ubiquinone oxidoreductase subunit 6 (subunit J)